ncbi:MAG TPA: glycosyltransferase family 4 protein [Candidatus Acidoferrales bacterium]|nr:glycosyltransferase family 4 protein [Candidatus Acidoferrales bacterium]
MARILYVTQGYCTHDRRFLERIVEAGHEIWFVPCEAASVQSDLPRVSGSISWLPPLGRRGVAPGSSAWMAAAGRFRRVVNEVAPDLVNAGPIQTGGFFAALAGFHPLLMMSWGSDVLFVPDQTVRLKGITQFALRRADMVIADCEAVCRRIAEFSGLRSGRIVTLPWGIDLEQFQPKVSALQLRRRLGWEGCKVVISTRSFEPIHGSLIFLEAVKRVLSHASDVRILMLGDGRLRKRVETFIQENELADKVYLAGRVPEEMMPDYFAEANLYVSATHCDGSSISLLQAMGCGLPVVVTKGYGNNEWVTDGENGWLYPAGDASALAAKIMQALRDDASRTVAGRANMQIVRERANWSRNCSRVLEAYDKLLGNKSAGRMRNAQLQNW